MKEVMEFEGEMGVVKDDSSGGGSIATTSSGDGRGGVKEKRRRSKLWLFRRLKIKESWKWRRLSFLGSAFKWKRHSLQRMQLPIVDNLLFKIVSVLETIVLVAALCFFYLCCGCHI